MRKVLRKKTKAFTRDTSFLYCRRENTAAGDDFDIALGSTV